MLQPLIRRARRHIVSELDATGAGITCFAAREAQQARKQYLSHSSRGTARLPSGLRRMTSCITSAFTIMTRRAATVNRVRCTHGRSIGLSLILNVFWNGPSLTFSRSKSNATRLFCSVLRNRRHPLSEVQPNAGADQIRCNPWRSKHAQTTDLETADGDPARESSVQTRMRQMADAWRDMPWWRSSCR